jgi:hypothetical protein
LPLIDRAFSSSPTGWNAAGKDHGVVSAGEPASRFVDLIWPVNEGKSREFRDKNPANEEQAGGVQPPD